MLTRENRNTKTALAALAAMEAAVRDGRHIYAHADQPSAKGTELTLNSIAYTVGQLVAMGGIRSVHVLITYDEEAASAE